MKVILVWLLAGVLSAVPSNAGQSYDAPGDCQVTSVLGGKEQIALFCRIRTINSAIDATNFSVIPGARTVRLRIECSDVLFFQSSLRNNSFVRLAQLKELVLEYCKIGEIPRFALTGLSNLQNLTLKTYNTEWSAMSLNIHPYAFKDLSKLERLNLSFNNIWSLPSSLFCDLTNLSLLNLAKNKLQDIGALSFNQGNTRCAQSLRNLDVSYNHFSVVQAYAFSSLKNLSTLNLSLNAVQEITDQALFGMYSLQVLDVSGNLLTTLPPELFKETKRLTVFIAKNNSIAVLGPGLLSGLDMLLELNLSENELTNTWINSETFMGLIRLARLDLSYNKIGRLDIATFRDLTNLQVLNLQFNNIEMIADRTFSGLDRLHTLVLSDNKLKAIDSRTLAGLVTLAELRLDNNEIAFLHNEALSNSTKVKELHIRNNFLKSIPVGINNLSLLLSLDISGNEIENISEGNFVNKKLLKLLNLAENKIEAIRKATFQNMTSLQIINLNNNNIYSIENGAFDKNKNLKAVRVDDNALTNIYGLFSTLNKLKFLNVSQNRLRMFDFAFVPLGLEYLDLRSNSINELANHFRIEDKLSLKILDVSFNRLRAISATSVPTSIEVLFLNNNSLSSIQPYTFFKKKHLIRVDLFANQLKHIDPNDLRIPEIEDPDFLPEFYLAQNPFECDCNMEWLQKINNQEEVKQTPKVVDLTSVSCHLLNRRHQVEMPLLEVDKHQFLCRYESHCFPSCHCCDFDACDCEMICPSGCHCYHDETWTANIVDCSRGGHFTIPDRIPMDASEVYLDGNTLTSLSSHTFIGRRNLKVLFANDSNIDSVYNRTFNGLKQLQILRLENNLLKELKGYEFENLLSLRELYLHNNSLQVINNATFSTLVSLAILRLDGNNLKYLASAFHFLSPGMKELWISKNPWKCDCSHIKVVRLWLQGASGAVKDGKDVACRPNETSSIGFPILAQNFSQCLSVMGTKSFNHAAYEDYVYLPTITLGCFAFLIAVLLIVFYNRNRVRVWVFAKYGIRLFYRSEFEGDNNKLFDSFVSYSSKDDVFVTQILAPELERGSSPYKLCLHYRDFPMGTYVSDTIMSAVETSRRTILVLSENFMKSEWSRFEFRSAHHRVLQDRRRRLIVILLGDVPQRDLDPDIRLYLKTNTYLKWGDKRFWEKLKFAMPNARPASRGHQLNSISHSASQRQ